MGLEIKSDALKISIKEKDYLRAICNFEKSTVEEAIKKVDEYVFLDNKNDKRLWALLGRDEKIDEWVCLEVGSNQNIKSEIKGDLKLMIETPKRVFKGSAFHKNFFEFYTYSDRQSCKYRAIVDMYKEYRWCEIIINAYVNDQEVDFRDTINYAEVKFALETKALFWNPSPAVYGNQEKEILSELLSKDII